jgi:flagellar hook-associated protein 3 FlgL
MLTQQSNLNETQMKISSGKQYLNPSENPVAASSLIDINQNIQENQQYQVNISSAQAKLQLETSTLSSATDVLQSVRDLTVQGLNDSNSASNRQQIATQINQLNQQLMTLANTQDANGQYLFSGSATSTQPFVATPAYAYQGNTTQMNVTIGPQNRQVTENDPGQAVFGTIVTPPPALVQGSISNIFQAISQLTTDLNNNAPNAASLQDIDTAISRISTIQASVGSKLNVLTSQQSINATTILDNQTTSSSIGDLDMTSAISQLSLQQTSLQAAQQAFIKVGGMSIFQYM